MAASAIFVAEYPITDTLPRRLAFRLVFFRPAVDVLLAFSGFLFGDGAHPFDIGRQRLGAKDGGILDEGFNAAAEIDDLLAGGRVIERVFQSGEPAEILRAVVAAIGIDVVNNHVRLGLRAMEGRADDLMDTNVAGEDHVPVVRILGTEAPDVIQLTGPTTFFGKAADGTVVTGLVSAVLVFTFADLSILVQKFFVFHRL